MTPKPCLSGAGACQAQEWEQPSVCALTVCTAWRPTVSFADRFYVVLIPHHMENYTKVRNIGKGNMGACVLVRHTQENKLYVMKLIDLSKMTSKERTASLNEARVLSSLDHPNVIKYHDSFLSRKTEHLCIVMEYAEGGDLAHKIKHAKGNPFSEAQVSFAGLNLPLLDMLTNTLIKMNFNGNPPFSGASANSRQLSVLSSRCS